MGAPQHLPQEWELGCMTQRAVSEEASMHENSLQGRIFQRKREKISKSFLVRQLDKIKFPGTFNGRKREKTDFPSIFITFVFSPDIFAIHLWCIVPFLPNFCIFFASSNIAIYIWEREVHAFVEVPLIIPALPNFYLILSTTSQLQLTFHYLFFLTLSQFDGYLQKLLSLFIKKYYFLYFSCCHK